MTHPSNNPSDSLTWTGIAEIDQMGFEIGNRGWSCLDLSVPRNSARLLGDLALVEFELDKVEVPRPISFAYCQDSFGPEALEKLDSRGYRFGRRGVEPRPSSPGFDPTKPSSPFHSRLRQRRFRLDRKGLRSIGQPCRWRVDCGTAFWSGWGHESSRTKSRR